MLRRFASWFIAFGFSFLVAKLGWASQGTAFICIVAGLTCLSFAIGDGALEEFGLSSAIAKRYVICLAIIFLATWVATLLFDVEFAVAFQIISFGHCLCGSENDN